MALTHTQQQFMLTRLNAVWPQPRHCPACRREEWVVGSVCEVKDFQPGGSAARTSVTPLIQVSCAICGATLLFNAIAVGLVDATTGDYVVA